jgi:uncharacterized protein YjiS (DUF1127 family)
MSELNAATITRELNTHALLTRSNAIAKQPGLLPGLFARWRLWRRVRRDEAWLKGQPAYLLRDVGLERGEVNRALREARYR